MRERELLEGQWFPTASGQVLFHCRTVAKIEIVKEHASRSYETDHFDSCVGTFASCFVILLGSNMTCCSPSFSRFLATSVIFAIKSIRFPAYVISVSVKSSRGCICLYLSRIPWKISVHTINSLFDPTLPECPCLWLYLNI